MSVEAPETPGVEELRELYLRYKALVFGATARILLAEPIGTLVVDAGALLGVPDIGPGLRSAARVQFNACECAAVELREMLAEAGDEGIGSARLASVGHRILTCAARSGSPYRVNTCRARQPLRTHTSDRSPHD